MDKKNAELKKWEPVRLILQDYMYGKVSINDPKLIEGAKFMIKNQDFRWNNWKERSKQEQERLEKMFKTNLKIADDILKANNIKINK